MTEIFLYIVNMSITATILAVVVLLLRLLLKKAPKWISVLLWGLVAIRLICPFAVESPFSLMPKTDWLVQEPLTEEDLFLNSAPDSIPAFDSSSFGSDVTVQYSYYPLENSNIEIHRGISSSFILSCIWAAGMAALLLHTVISTIRLHKSIGAAIRVRDNVWESSAVESPFVLGMIRPRIYVPRGMSEEKLAYVIAHEEAHIRRKDHWWKPLGFLLLTIHWFNPVLWLAYILLCRDIEMACDERVIKEYDDVQRADYSEALLDCSVKRKMITACPLAFGEVSVKERIKSVLNYKKPAFWIVVFAVVACIVTAVCFLTNPLEKTTPADIFNDIKVSEVEWGQVTVWNDERNTVLLSEEQRIELTEILQSIDSSDYEMKNFDSDVTVMLYCGEKEILLHYDNGYVGFTFDSVTAASLENISWVVQNMTLNLFLDTICHTESTESNHVSIPQDSIPAPVSDYENDIIEQAAESIFGTVTVYASGIDKLEKIPTATVGISDEILLYRLDYWITKGINGLVGTPPEDIYRETVYFAMFNDWTSDTWVRLGTITEDEINAKYGTAEMILRYGNKFTAAAAEMGHAYLGDMNDAEISVDNSIVNTVISFIKSHITKIDTGLDGGSYSSVEDFLKTYLSDKEDAVETTVPKYNYNLDISVNAYQDKDTVIYLQCGLKASWNYAEDIDSGYGKLIEVLVNKEDGKIIDVYDRTNPFDIAVRGDTLDLSESTVGISPDIVRTAKQTYLQSQGSGTKPPVEFTAVIKEFDTDAWENGEMQLNIVEFITPDDTERIAELELSDQDMISGYYIHDEDESITLLKMPEDTEYIFFDWWDAYTDETDERYEILGERWISTRNAELFYEYWLPYADSPGYPFVFTASEEKVIVKEIPLM